MSALVIRNLPDDVHDALRNLARKQGQSVEALAREVLTKAANDARPTGIDFDAIAEERARLGIAEDGPEWTEALDDPALSRRLLGLEED
jgi:plasmid stability protein